jgi:hypothetical protein
MSKRHGDNKKQKTLLNYFSKPTPSEKVQNVQTTTESTHHVANSMSAMSIDNDNNQEE